MQRPRRTTEFIEEPAKPQTRSQAGKSPAASVAGAATTATKKYSRASRIAVSTRPPSLDRLRPSNSNFAPGSALRVPRIVTRAPSLERQNSNNALNAPSSAASQSNRIAKRAPSPHARQVSTLYPPNSATRGGGTRGVTPQKSISNISRALQFTAEKRGCNDKKWVHEQAQNIADRLRDLKVPGLGAEFFARTNALQQMSIKQFVAIINYCLQCISGSRLSVGTNYIEDVINVMQKLHYPHQLNKSWLKTPNTQHSFGNVIQLLDFLLSFIPQESDELQFPLQQQLTLNISNAEMHELLPSAEFQAQLQNDARAAFVLWDKQLMPEEAQKKQQTCDAFIYMRCGVANLAALDSELQQLRQTCAELEAQRTAPNIENENELSRLRAELSSVLQQIEQLQVEMQESQARLKTLKTAHRKMKVDMANLEEETAELQAMKRQQVYSIEKRDKLIEMVTQLKQLKLSEERRFREQQDRNHKEQVAFSRAQNQLIIEIEQFNVQLNEIKAVHSLKTATKGLRLSMKTEENEMKLMEGKLEALRQQIETKEKTLRAEEQQLKIKMAQIEHNVKGMLEPQLNSLNAAVSAAQKSLAHKEALFAEECHTLDKQLNDLQAEAQKLDSEIMQCEFNICKTKQEAEQLEQENEKRMSSEEEAYNREAVEREQFLDAYAAKLHDANVELDNLRRIIAENTVELQNMEKKCGGV